MNHKVIMYYHGGSKNHGCEAIVRATAKIFDEKMETYSMYPAEDEIYGLEEAVTLKYDREQNLKKPSLKYYLSALEIKLFHKTRLTTYFKWKDFFKAVKKESVYLATGGDNYCYTGLEKLADYNLLIRQKGGKTVLWGCSIEPDSLSENVIKDLKNYNLIVARESLTVKALEDKGITSNVVMFPDPAFMLDRVDLPLPQNFVVNNMVGINLSPLIVSCEKQEGITRANYIKLIDYILKETNMGIALIPHVVKGGSNDLLILREIYDLYKNTERVVLLEDYPCTVIKGFIARCRFFVGARTHATIAAYSSKVPTLVVGYSIKAKGIAKDLFGSYENYVIPVQNLKNTDDIVQNFKWLVAEEENIKDVLNEKIPLYCNKLSSVRKVLEERI